MTAQKNQWELDKLQTQSEMLKKFAVDEVDSHSKEGAYIIGLSMQGARWDPNAVSIEKSKVRNDPRFHAADLYPWVFSCGQNRDTYETCHRSVTSGGLAWDVLCRGTVDDNVQTPIVSVSNRHPAPLCLSMIPQRSRSGN